MKTTQLYGLVDSVLLFQFAYFSHEIYIRHKIDCLWPSTITQMCKSTHKKNTLFH